MPCRNAKLAKSCGKEIVFFRNFRSPVRETVTKFTCMCSRATSMDSTIVAPSNKSCKSSNGNLKHGSMWLSSDRRATTTARSSSPPCDFSCLSMSFWHRKHVPIHANAGPSRASSGGSSSQLDTSTLQAAKPSLPRLNICISFAMVGGGSYAG